MRQYSLGDGEGCWTKGWTCLGRTVPFVVVAQSLSHVQLFTTPLPAAHHTSLSFTFSWRLLKAHVH